METSVCTYPDEVMQARPFHYSAIGSCRLPRAAGLLLSILAALAAAPVIAQPTVYPNLQEVKAPAANPPLPFDDGSFAPPVGAVEPSGEAPAIAEWTRMGEPGNILALTGHQFSRNSGPLFGTDTDFMVYGGNTNGKLLPAGIRHLDSLKSAIELPEGLPEETMYIVWPQNEAGAGYPAAVNQTEAWWVGPDRAAAGDTVSVYGRNLTRQGSTHTGRFDSWVYIQGAGWATVVEANPYRVQFIVPPGLGEREVWVHNGKGGKYGWSAPLKLTVRAPIVWSGPTFNVKDYGAVGDGVTDDYAAITAARDAAKRVPYSTLYFPAGTYLTSQSFWSASQIRWLGEGKNNSTIRCAPSFEGSFLIENGVTVRDVALERLTFDAGSNISLSRLVQIRAADGLLFKNLRLISHGSSTLDFHNSRHIHLQDSEIVGKGTFMGSASQVFIDGCAFYGTNDANVLLYSWGGKDICLTNSSAQDLDNSDPNSGAGWSKGRFFTGAGNWGAMRNLFIAGNTTTDLTPRPSVDVDQNSGEQFMWEGFPHIWTGTPTAINSTSVTLPGFSGTTTDIAIAVVSGKGLGQVRYIDSIKGNLVILKEPWRIRPDVESVLAIVTPLAQIVLFDNRIDGKPRSYESSTHIASAGIQPWEGAFDFVAEKNVITDVREAFRIEGFSNLNEDEIKPVFFNLYANNTIRNVRVAFQLSGRNPKRGINMLGNVMRNNSVTNALSALLHVKTRTGSTNPEPWVTANVLDHTTTTAVAQPVVFEGPEQSIANTVFNENDFGISTTSGTLGFSLRELTVSDSVATVEIPISLLYTDQNKDLGGFRLDLKISSVPGISFQRIEAGEALTNRDWRVSYQKTGAGYRILASNDGNGDLSSGTYDELMRLVVRIDRVESDVIAQFGLSGVREAPCCHEDALLSSGLGFLDLRILGSNIEVEETQILELEQGWNLVSLQVEPRNTNLDTLLATVLSSTVLVKNNDGQVFSPDFGIRDLSTWKTSEGYQIYVSQPNTLSVEGRLIRPEINSIPLKKGSNLVPYYRNAPMDVSDALVSIAPNLVLVMDQAGSIYYPINGVKALSILKPGQSYKIYVAQSDTLVYPPNDATQSMK